MAKSLSKKPARRKLKVNQTDFFAAESLYDLNTGSQKFMTQDMGMKLHPPKPQDAFKQARDVKRDNGFIAMCNPLKVAFYNFRCGIKAVDKQQQKKLDDYFKSNLGIHRRIRKFIKDCWTERIDIDNVVAFWRDDENVESSFRPFLLRPENCKYSNAFGREVLKVKNEFTREQLRDAAEAGVDEEMIRRYQNNEITLSAEDGENFRVLTRSYDGHGFSWPRMLSIFTAAMQNESMEAGENVLAYALRLIIRLHKFGFEIRNTDPGNIQREFSMFRQPRWTAVKNKFKGRQGLYEAGTNFDHLIELIWGGKGLDLKWFDERKWGTVERRMMNYAGPIGAMLFAKTVSPFLLNMAKVQAADEREDMATFLEECINEGFRPPTQIRLTWSNRCFYDQRLAWDMVKAMMQQGPFSLRSALEEVDLDPDKEAERKVMEADDPQSKKKYFPIYDPAHGAPDQAGRPRTVEKGSTNPSGPPKPK